MSNAFLPTILANVERPARSTTKAVLRQLYGQADYCVLLLGAGGEILWENPAATKLLAAEFESLQGRDVLDPQHTSGAGASLRTACG